MKKAVLLSTMFFLVAAFAFAQTTSEATKAAATTPTPTPPTTTTATATGIITTLKGDIIDNMCAGAQKPEQLSEFVKTHTKQCALQPQCEASGYSIFSEGKLMKFDKASNPKIAEFLKKPESKLQVMVMTKKAGEELSLVSIANQ
jgi:hypothetical protein